MKTYTVTPVDIVREWYVIDAKGKTLGRLATEVARLLRGKHKPIFTPYTDCGDFVIVVNADKIRVTGHKMDDKMYYRHSGYPGGFKVMNLRTQLAQFPTRTVELAVRGMLPKGRLGRAMYRKLKVYASETHPHEAQKPKAWNW
ncbi:MAG: 50S ribosomal protein L13 [Anaerolineae bacterium]|nr:50S ribosomal protein L13 [Anaerolineae bacterium]